MSRVVHFEIPADNPERVAEFYNKVLDWDIQKWDNPMDYWLISTGKDSEPGIHGGIARKKDWPASGVLVTAQGDSVDECLKKIINAGGSIVVQRRVIPGVGYQAHFRNPEGNEIGIMENDPSARWDPASEREDSSSADNPPFNLSRISSKRFTYCMMQGTGARNIIL